jgi:putative flippase GtrA
MLKFITRTFRTRQFARFLLAGASSALLQWLARFGLGAIFDFPTAVVLAFGVGVTVGFGLNLMFVFPASGGSRRRAALWYVTVNLLGFPLVWAVSVLFGDVLLAKALPHEQAEAVGNGLGILSPVAVNFLFHKYVTFRETRH